jgi:hypothetical protein
MNGKYCLIRQPAGLGDIFFCQKIAHKVIEKYNCKVIWPVLKQYKYIKDYLAIPQGLEFYSNTDHFPYSNIFNTISNVKQTTNFIYIPLQDADSLYPDFGLMEAKYKMVNLCFNDWQNYFDFDRFKDREEKIWNHFNLKDEEKYNIINSKYGSLPNTLEICNIKINNDYRIITLDSLGFDNIFDWCKVLENAEEIHTVNTSWCYLIEKLNTKAKLFMYMRGNQSNFEHYTKGVFKKNWTYIN